ncbi:hypothetical protein [Arundinibacter roseus]|nr:hypothetical protein [Arundinibacter roseus]
MVLEIATFAKPQTVVRHYTIVDIFTNNIPLPFLLFVFGENTNYG